MIQTEVRRDVNTKQTNMAAGNSSVSTKVEYRIHASQRGTLKCFYFFLVGLWHVPIICLLGLYASCRSSLRKCPYDFKCPFALLILAARNGLAAKHMAYKLERRNYITVNLCSTC